MKKVLSYLLILALTAALAVPMASAVGYTDIPEGAALAEEVQKAVNYDLMNGYSSTKFGYSDSMTRAQFTAVLVRMMGWETVTPETPTYADVPADHTWYSVLETAAAHGVTDFTDLKDGSYFRPGDAITRAEMAKLLVQALELENAAICLNYDRMTPYSDTLHHTPFTDLPEGHEGYISVAYTIGMTKGITDTTFGPNLTATRAQAAAMLVRIYEKMNVNTDFIHGFYAISSYSQLGLAENMDTVSAGWSRMTWDGTTALLSTTSANGNEYAIPSGYQEVTEALAGKLNLSVYMDASDGVVELLASEEGRQQAVEQIVNELTVTYKAIGKNPYSGVTIDFESIGSANRENFVAFLTTLSKQVKALDRPLSIYVCVQPVPSGSSVYWNAYDYQSIGALADKVILMAHDYDPRVLESYLSSTYYEHCATVTLGSVYLDLRDVIERVEPEKVVLAFSARNVAWQIDEDGNLVSRTSVSVSTETVAKRLAQKDTVKGWSQGSKQSYAIYTTEDGSRYFLWYQDEASVEAELRTAKLLGVTGVSLWRLGIIPDSADWNWNSLLS
jgi:spore germination protein YaaH